MSKSIDINDITTYPEKLLNYCKEKEDILSSIIKDDYEINDESLIYRKIFHFIENYNVIAIHTTRINNKDSICENGLIVPSIDKDKIISIILNPIRYKLDEKQYIKIKEKMENEILTNDTYSRLHFVIGKRKDITLDNGFYFLEKYGGEFLEDIFTNLDLQDFYKENIKYFGKPYIIWFKVKINKLNQFFLKDIINYMYRNIINKGNLHFYKESYITYSITKEDIKKIEIARSIK